MIGGLVEFDDGRGGIWTTTDALNSALGLNVVQSEDAAPYDVEMF